MAFVSDTVTLSRVSADLFNMTLGKANVREGTIDGALAISEWPRDLDLLIVDIGDAGDPVADAAALKTSVPGTCMVIGVGRINDVALYRDFPERGAPLRITIWPGLPIISWSSVQTQARVARTRLDASTVR